jgi:hydrogenase maturation protease
MKPLILCLGNEVLSDDGFGFVVANKLQHKYKITAIADVEAAAVAGFSLLDALDRRDHVLIVDTIQTHAVSAGTLMEFHAGQFTPTKNLTSSHQISLPQALALGKELGYTMPAVVDILAVEAADLETLQEELTPAVNASIEPAIEKIENWVFSLPEFYTEGAHGTRLSKSK